MGSCRTVRLFASWIVGHKYDCNIHPMAPPDTRTIMYEGTGNRNSWGAICTNAWYYSPTLNHYRNCTFYVPAMRA